MIVSGPLSREWAMARNILVMRPDNIGDVVMTGPVFHALKQSLPQSRLSSPPFPCAWALLRSGVAPN
jgi:hypothetical protein